MRQYNSEKDVAVIAAEVMSDGVSANWKATTPEETELATKLEDHLAKFNIGYTDDTTGSWAHRKNGSRYFASKKIIKATRGGISRVISFLQR